MGKLGLGPVGLALNVSASYLADAAEAERLGYSALWLPGGQLDDLARLAALAGATSAVPVGSSIISPDAYPAGPDRGGPGPGRPMSFRRVSRHPLGKRRAEGRTHGTAGGALRDHWH